MASHEQDSESPRKRRKTVESCKRCRVKKTRCDGQRPVCSPCSDKGVPCEYNDATITVTASSLVDVQERLRRLEQRTLATPTYPAIPTVHSYNVPDDTSIGNHQVEAERTFVEHPTTYFIRQITRSADSRSATKPLGEKDVVWPIETNIGSMVIPPRIIADDLVNCFETYVHPLFPVLHMPTFHTRYSQIWESQAQSRSRNLATEATFHAALNAVFALGCLNNSNVESELKLRTANTFYQRTRMLLPLDALDTPTVETVQYLLLTTIYLTYTRYSCRCSNTLAVAIRNAQTLGLFMNIDQSSNGQIDREMYRRVWYHCLMLERLVSSLFGRMSILGSNIMTPLRQSTDDEGRLDDDVERQPAGTNSDLDALIASVKVFEVLDGGQKTDYESIHYSFGLHELAEILQLNEKLDGIENSLPVHLKYNNAEDASIPRDQVAKLQSEAVMMRILHVRLALLRPHVLAAARNSLLSLSPAQPASSAEVTLRRAVSSLSIQSAVSAIGVLHGNLRSTYRIVSSTAVFVALSAATVVIAASLVPDLDVSLEPGDGGYGEIVTKALQVLQGHQWQIEGARGAMRQLEGFLTTAKNAKARRNSTRINVPADNTFRLDSGGLFPGIATDLGIDLNDPLWSVQCFDSSFWPDTAGSQFDALS